MSKEVSELLKDNTIINFNYLMNKIVTITADINEITFTSEGKICYGAILIKKREDDLKIIIKDLYLNSGNEIAIDFRSGNDNGHKNIIEYFGENTIISENNIGICISNNQIVEIQGYEESRLRVIGGISKPAIGNNLYTVGSGQLIFSNAGTIELEGGHGYSQAKGKEYKGKDGAYAMGFISNYDEGASVIKILDKVNLKAVGGNGDGISTITKDKACGYGGAAISISNNGTIEKIGTGKLELIGGDGGECTGEYKCGNCGHGGSAIKIGNGLIKIYGTAILSGGNGGSISSKERNVISIGGTGGDCILVCGNTSDSLLTSTKIIIDDFIEGRGGKGGNSGIDFNGTYISANRGGTGGSFINSNDNKVEIVIGKIIFKEGQGGKGGKYDVDGEDGIPGEMLKGSKISYSEFVKVAETSEIEVQDLIEIMEIKEDSVTEVNGIKDDTIIEVKQIEEESIRNEIEEEHTSKEKTSSILRRAVEYFNNLLKGTE